ncbi:MAG: CDGSH iron-sulfur domain-containing protein [Acidimicrobiales bacterium]|jgi:CDGSH-type Zn-finger protein
MADVTVNVRTDGPLLVQGPCQVKDQDGNVIVDSDAMVALCRCGLSNSKPMCDGSHTDNFDGTLNPPS